jgi:hypothetical protein
MDKKGFCKHGRMLIYCEVCYPIFQEAENKKWIAKQRAIKEAYQRSQDSRTLYYSMTGTDPQVKAR